MPAMEMVHVVDPAKALLDQVGNLDDYDVCGSNVLVAIYQRPDRTKSGIFVSDATREEERYQGKAGLVLKLGPLAFVESPEHGVTFPTKAKVGDWILFRPSDTWPLKINKVDCRMMSDVSVRMLIPAPDKVY